MKMDRNGDMDRIRDMELKLTGIDNLIGQQGYQPWRSMG